MLVVSRRPEEIVLLPTLGITIRVLKVHHGRVSLGISAPDRVRITRRKTDSLPRSILGPADGPEISQ